MTDIDTAAIRTWADTHEPHAWTLGLCDALDAARAELAELHCRATHAVDSATGRAEAAEARYESMAEYMRAEVQNHKDGRAAAWNAAEASKSRERAAWDLAQSVGEELAVTKARIAELEAQRDAYAGQANGFEYRITAALAECARLGSAACSPRKHRD
jgi:hypothetical protein